MFRTSTWRTAAVVAVLTTVALIVTGCGDLSDSPPDPSASPGCADACAARIADPIIPTPVPVPTLDPALVAWRNSVHDQVAALMKDLGAIDGCGGAQGDDRADCRSKVTTLMTAAKAMRDAMDPHNVPPDAVDDAGKISDALDVILQGCAHDDAALASNQMFVWLPGTTTAQGFQQLVAEDDALRTA
jgi:hypothetical protein